MLGKQRKRKQEANQSQTWLDLETKLEDVNLGGNTGYDPKCEIGKKNDQDNRPRKLERDCPEGIDYTHHLRHQRGRGKIDG